MTTELSKLREMLRNAKSLGTSASPYIGLKLLDDKAFIHRSGETGYVESDLYSKVEVEPIIVSLQHLLKVMSVMESETIQLTKDKQGVLQVSGPGGEVKVFTVRPGTAWNKAFKAGSLDTTLNPELLERINLGGMELSLQPQIFKDFIHFTTYHGIARKAFIAPPTASSPREEFLRVASGNKLIMLGITTTGYWVAKSDDFRFVVAGHTSKFPLATHYCSQGKLLCTFESPQFLYALDAAISLSEEGDRFTLSPKNGFEVHNGLGDSKFTLTADNSTWPTLNILRKTSAVIRQCLKQDASETITLSSVNAGAYRLSRGSWDFTFAA